MTAATGNYIVEILFLLTFIVGLLWPARRHH
ncbi:hypothetical protein Sulac_0812 [Sulfobacillus acidophilus DSM 10332]|uniref:Uncharacterized protein n=1 Tax=Sulfobacillus acidophilus (strain ATCC 700253 / DSM 10332 / NAL) TaxID=679936 RepID=G8U182_SULAD|nr:hypothetical protein Sulac_0812 [Sulfobacillus acidophilus DSM 10332]